jgi:hypothetical protein
VQTKKFTSHSSKKSRNSRSASGGDVGAEGMVTKLANWWSPRTKYKRSKNAVAVMSIALTFGTTVLELLVQ